MIIIMLKNRSLFTLFKSALPEFHRMIIASATIMTCGEKISHREKEDPNLLFVFCSSLFI